MNDKIFVDDEFHACSVVSDTGLPCQKQLYHTQNDEYWDHAGGHIFAATETFNKLRNQHYDATAMLKGEPVVFHSPEECTYDGFCSWRKHNRQ